MRKKRLPLGMTRTPKPGSSASNDIWSFSLTFRDSTVRFVSFSLTISPPVRIAHRFPVCTVEASWKQRDASRGVLRRRKRLTRAAEKSSPFRGVWWYWRQLRTVSHSREKWLSLSHNLKVRGSNPLPATNFLQWDQKDRPTTAAFFQGLHRRNWHPRPRSAKLSLRPWPSGHELTGSLIPLAQ